MSQAEKVLVPSHHYEAGDAQGLLSEFDPGTRVLPAGFRIDPKFRSLPVDIVLEKDIAVTLRDGALTARAREPLPLSLLFSG